MTAAVVHGGQMAAARQDRGNVASGQDPEMLAEIYEPAINLAVWQRTLPGTVTRAAEDVARAGQRGTQSLTVNSQNVTDSVARALGLDVESGLVADISELVAMFSCLFEHQTIGLRIAALERPMCPRFHVDHVPCRLITTYCGVATQWLPDQSADRSRLGKVSAGVPDESSGLFAQPSDVQQLGEGDVALLKGEAWLGNEGHGVIHRSPAVPQGARRLVVTMDMV